MKPDSKLKERNPSTGHPENQPDQEGEKKDAGFEEASFDDPTRKNEKRPDPNWQKGQYSQDEREGRPPEEKTYDGE